MDKATFLALLPIFAAASIGAIVAWTVIHKKKHGLISALKLAAFGVLCFTAGLTSAFRAFSDYMQH